MRAYVTGAINGAAFARRGQCRSRHSPFNLRLVLICGRWSQRRIEDDRYVAPRETGDRLSSFVARKRKREGTRDQPLASPSLLPSSPSFYLFVLTIGYKAFHRETIDSTVLPPFSGDSTPDLQRVRAKALHSSARVL